MKKHKGKITTSIIMLIMFGSPIVFFYVLNYGNPYEEYLVTKHVPKHLEEQGYSKADIKSQTFVLPKQLINKDVHHDHYEVVFKDEPDISYYYAVKVWSHEVVQFCEKEKNHKDGLVEPLNGKTLHSEKSCLDSYANRD